MKTLNSSNKKTILIIVIATLGILAIAGLIINITGYRYISTDYAKYSGFTKDGRPTNGTVRYTDGTKGKLTTDKDSGEIKITYSTGDVYTGDFKGIIRDGKGKIEYACGDIYEGNFKNDVMTGSALITYADGSVYNGEIVDGMPHGKGTATFSDSSWYYGEFENGKKNGLGEYHAADGSCYYGRFVNDLKDGTEVYTFELSDGSMFKGECRFVFASGSVYSGDFVKDKCTGIGTFTWSSGEKYEGEFKNGLFNGHGTYYFSDPDMPSYTGTFENGKIVETKQPAASAGTESKKEKNNNE